MRDNIFTLATIPERTKTLFQIWGLYGLILVIAGAQWAGITFILQHTLNP